MVAVQKEPINSPAHKDEICECLKERHNFKNKGQEFNNRYASYSANIVKDFLI